MFEAADKFIAILFSLLIFAQAYCIRRAVGTFIFPACLLSLAWFMYTIIPLILLFDVPVNPLSVLYIFSCVSAFSLGALPFNWPQAFKTNKLKNACDYSKFNSKFILYFFYISSGSSIIFSTISIAASGFDLNYLFFNLLVGSGQFAAMRGNESLDYTIWGSISILFTYATAIFGGLTYQQQQKNTAKLVILLISFIPSIYFMITQSSKLIMFYAIGFFCASVLLKKIYLNELYLFKRSFFYRIIAYALLLTPLISLSFVSRQGYSDFNSTKELLEIIFNMFSSYALGEFYAFSDFFSNYLGVNSQLNYEHDFNSYGYYTFTSILDFICGKKQFPPGTFLDFYYYKDRFSTNIFTIFRGLINDFGGIGTIFFMFVSGLTAHAFFFRLLKSRSSWISCSVFIITVVFIQQTYLMSIFMARFAYILLVFLFFILWINDSYYKNQCIRDSKLKKRREQRNIEPHQIVHLEIQPSSETSQP